MGLSMVGDLRRKVIFWGDTKRKEPIVEMDQSSVALLRALYM